MENRGPVSRRKWITAAAVVPFSAVRGTTANSALKIGLIGAGGRGRLDAGILVKDRRARLVAICDLFEDRMERARKELQVEDAKLYKNYHEMLASDVDAVLIATNEFMHPEHLEAAVKAKKHVYIEKPAGVDVEGCRRVMRAGDAAGPRLNITFGFQQRYGPGYRKAKKLLDSGGIGPLRMAHAHWIKGAITGNETVLPRPTNMLDKVRQHLWRETVGDIIVDTYCHGVDVLNWFFGEHPSKAIGGGGRTIIKVGDIRDHLDVIFDYSRDLQATLAGSQIAPTFYRSVNEQFFGATGVIETAREYWTHYRGRNDTVTEKEPRDITIDAIEEFLTRVIEGKPENTAISAAETTLTSLMGRMALDLRREVTWEEVMRS